MVSRHQFVEQPESSSIQELCAHVEVAKVVHGVTLRDPCLKPRADHDLQ